jgi:hypothetical protein
MKTQGHANHLATKVTEINDYITYIRSWMSDDHFSVTMSAHKELQFWNEISNQSKYLRAAADDLRDTAVAGMALAENRYKEEEL